ncbi:hypothetical protein FRC20_001980 [Serendipita sp. 405]|nr:hypothetical protein FRC20_001980 [Serendipita sp. 405]
MHANKPTAPAPKTRTRAPFALAPTDVEDGEGEAINPARRAAWITTPNGSARAPNS